MNSEALRQRQERLLCYSAKFARNIAIVEMDFVLQWPLYKTQTTDDRYRILSNHPQGIRRHHRITLTRPHIFTSSIYMFSRLNVDVNICDLG